MLVAMLMLVLGFGALVFSWIEARTTHNDAWSFVSGISAWVFMFGLIRFVVQDWEFTEFMCPVWFSLMIYYFLVARNTKKSGWTFLATTSAICFICNAVVIVLHIVPPPA